VGEAVLVIGLVEVPGFDVRHDRDDGGGVIDLNEEGEAVGEDGAVNGFRIHSFVGDG
jgi:hypothetical protein